MRQYRRNMFSMYDNNFKKYPKLYVLLLENIISITNLIINFKSITALVWNATLTRGATTIAENVNVVLTSPVKIKHGLQLVITKMRLTHTCANADHQKDNVCIRRKDVLRSKANVQKVRRQLLFLNPSRIYIYIWFKNVIIHCH